MQVALPYGHDAKMNYSRASEGRRRFLFSSTERATGESFAYFFRRRVDFFAAFRRAGLRFAVFFAAFRRAGFRFAVFFAAFRRAGFRLAVFFAAFRRAGFRFATFFGAALRADFLFAGIVYLLIANNSTALFSVKEQI